MTYSKMYFGKELDDLTYQDIEDFFIEEKGESDKIEFKSYFSTEEKNHSEKEKTVIKTICGLLNSEGGLIIWGAPIGQSVSGKKEKIFKGNLSPVDILIEKDSFIRKITDLITPAPNNIRFKLLECNGKYIYIIEVEQSMYSPHQFKNTYYMRIDGQTKIAPHHYIEALFRKITYPKLEGYITIDDLRRDQVGCALHLTLILFNQSKSQNEYELYYRLVVSCGKFSMSEQNNNGNKIYAMEGSELRVNNAKNTFYYSEPLRNSEIILIPKIELALKNYECDIYLIFGGKKSPLMISRYKLTLREYSLSNKNEYFISIDENKLMSEMDDIIGISHKEKMKNILGR